MDEKNIFIIATGIAFAAVMALSYWMALLGRPDAIWLWRDMLGVL